MVAIELTAWAVAAFGLTALMVWLLNPVAGRLGLVDYPTERKDHAFPTPLTGGIAMLVAVLVCGGLMFDRLGPVSTGFALAAVILVVMGALDDRFDLPWWSRMLVQVVAALILVYVGGFRIENLGTMFGPTIPALGVISVPFTVFAIVGAINAVNMADGADGFAGLLVLSCLVMIGIDALVVGNVAVYSRVPILIGAVAGFLAFNLRWPGHKRVTVFMGNSGSALLGLVVACFICRLTQSPQHSVAPVMALWLLPAPLLDCLVLMQRRVRHGHSPFSGDHNHAHHLMRKAGFGPTRSVLLLAVFSFACWLLVSLVLHLGVPQVLVFAAFVCSCFAWYWTTSRRERAVGMFRRLDRLTGGSAVAPPQSERAGT